MEAIVEERIILRACIVCAACSSYARALGWAYALNFRSSRINWGLFVYEGSNAPMCRHTANPR